jgi:hypothetical protein
MGLFHHVRRLHVGAGNDDSMSGNDDSMLPPLTVMTS